MTTLPLQICEVAAEAGIGVVDQPHRARLIVYGDQLDGNVLSGNAQRGSGGISQTEIVHAGSDGLHRRARALTLLYRYVQPRLLVIPLVDSQRQRRDIAVEPEVGAHDDLGLRQCGGAGGAERERDGNRQPCQSGKVGHGIPRLLRNGHASTFDLARSALVVMAPARHVFIIERRDISVNWNRFGHEHNKPSTIVPSIGPVWPEIELARIVVAGHESVGRSVGCDQCAAMPAAFMIGHHLSISAF